MNKKLITMCLTLCLGFGYNALNANAFETGERIGEDVVEAPLQAAGGLLGVVSGATRETGERTRDFFTGDRRREERPRYSRRDHRRNNRPYNRNGQ